MVNQRLIVFPDQSAYAGSSATLKAITGRDTIRAERNGDPNLFEFIVSGLVVITANDPIRFNDESDAVDRRRVFIKFKNQISDEQRAKVKDIRPRLNDALPAWIDHILSLDRDWVYQVIAKRREHTMEDRIERMIENDSLAEWLEDSVVVVPGGKTQVGDKMFPDSLYQSYFSYCDLNNNRLVAVKKFKTEMENLLNATLKWSTDTVYPKKDRNGAYWYGLELKTYASKGTTPLRKETWERYRAPTDVEIKF